MSGCGIQIGLRITLAMLLLAVVSSSGYANRGEFSPQEDSLLTLLQISPDRVKSKIYGELSDVALQTDTLQAKTYAKKSVEYAKLYDARFDLTQSHYRLGRILFFQDSLESALLSINKSVELSGEPDDESEAGRAYLHISGKSQFVRARIYQTLYPDSAKIILSDLIQALEKLQGTRDDKLLADINQSLGEQYFSLNIFDRGLKHLHQALEYNKILDDKHAMALLYMQMSYRVDRATGLNYAQKAIDLFAESGDSLRMARNLIHISFNSRQVLDIKDNFRYLQLGYDIYEKYHDYPGMVYALFHMATFTGVQTGDSAAMLRYLIKGAEISMKHHVVKSAGHIFITLGTYYKVKRQYDSAAYYLHIADSITAFMPGRPERIRYYIVMGDLLNAMERYDEAEDYLMEALKQAEIIDDWQLINIAYNTLYRTFKNQGDYEKALAFFEKNRDIKNRMINQSTEGKIAELQIRYDTEKMEHELAVMKKDQELKNATLRRRQIYIYTFASGLVLISVFALLIVRQLINKRKAYNKLMEKNLQLLKCENSGSKKQIDKNNNQSAIDPELRAQILKKLRYQIRHNKVYLKSDLSLTSLARKCQTNSSYLSKIIHTEYNTNFSGFINELRIKEAQKLMADKNYQSYSIEGIATSVGFKTKSVFNTSFKKFTGVTPSYYLEYLSKSEVSAKA